MNNENQASFNEFFKVFSESVVATLLKNLDKDICTKIECTFDSFVISKDTEVLKEQRVIYKMDYAVGSRQGNVALLIPEELISGVSDILTGGSGKDVYKGSLSEIETNSISRILTKIFKDLEFKFKQAYEKNLVFSASSNLLLKEMKDYELNSGGVMFDFVAEMTLSLNENDAFKLTLLLNKHIVELLMEDLGFTGSSATPRKKERSNIDINCLADIKINITAELGRAQVPIKYALELVQDSIVELDTQNNADIKVFANGIEFAYAQIVAIEDTFGLKITKIISPEERMGCI